MSVCISVMADFNRTISSFALRRSIAFFGSLTASGLVESKMCLTITSNNKGKCETPFRCYTIPVFILNLEPSVDIAGTCTKVVSAHCVGTGNLHCL